MIEINNQIKKDSMSFNNLWGVTVEEDLIKLGELSDLIRFIRCKDKEIKNSEQFIKYIQNRKNQIHQLLKYVNCINDLKKIGRFAELKSFLQYSDGCNLKLKSFADMFDYIKFRESQILNQTVSLEEYKKKKQAISKPHCLEEYGLSREEIGSIEQKLIEKCRKNLYN